MKYDFVSHDISHISHITLIPKSNLRNASKQIETTTEVCREEFVLKQITSGLQQSPHRKIF